MKNIAVLAALVCTFVVMGQDSMSTDFTRPESAKNWIFDGSPKNMPALKYGYDAEKKAFAVNNNDSKRNAYFKCPGRYVAAEKGNVIHVSFEACGNGRIFLTYECFSGVKWTGMGTRSKKTFQLKEEWTKFEDDLVVKDCKNLPTTKVMMDFCVMASGNMLIRSFSAVKAAK